MSEYEGKYEGKTQDEEQDVNVAKVNVQALIPLPLWEALMDRVNLENKAAKARGEESYTKTTFIAEAIREKLKRVS